MTILNDDHTEPHLTVTDRKSGEIVSQTFNFLDHIGGKQAVNAENVEQFLVMRGILASKGSQNLKTQKD